MIDCVFAGLNGEVFCIELARRDTSEASPQTHKHVGA